ncbi:MAG: hypothetical protein IT456_05455 [Planctomycetes bacterium]|nr:hypothetical protein [Planctomycetota bacterium]
MKRQTPRQKPKREFFECQHCGADVLVGSVACKECGSDASTGWQSAEEIDYQSLDLPGGYAADDGHPGGGRLPERRSPWFFVVLIVLVLLLLLLAVWR